MSIWFKEDSHKFKLDSSSLVSLKTDKDENVSLKADSLGIRINQTLVIISLICMLPTSQWL